jgi:hypothetical protein
MDQKPVDPEQVTREREPAADGLGALLSYLRPEVPALRL